MEEHILVREEAARRNFELELLKPHPSSHMELDEEMDRSIDRASGGVAAATVAAATHSLTLR